MIGRSFLERDFCRRWLIQRSSMSTPMSLARATHHVIGVLVRSCRNAMQANVLFRVRCSCILCCRRIRNELKYAGKLFCVFYKLTQNNLPAYFNSFLIRRQHNIHEHLTRNRHMLVTEKVHYKFAEKCIRYSVFKTVNDTPTQIIDKMYTHSLQGVANYSKNLLINEYDVRCCIRDCYICK